VHNATDFYQDIKTELITIPDTSFTSAQQKDLLVQELEVVQDLQETSANPQAVLVNIDNFQRSVNRSVVDVNARTSLNENIDLYRIVYVNSITP